SVHGLRASAADWAWSPDLLRSRRGRQRDRDDQRRPCRAMPGRARVRGRVPRLPEGIAEVSGGLHGLMTSSRLRIIVTWLIAQRPSVGGVTWDYLQYVVGLARLGHDVYYFEDSGEWPYTPDGGPSGQDWTAHDCRPNVDHLTSTMERFGLAERWAYRF